MSRTYQSNTDEGSREIGKEAHEDIAGNSSMGETEESPKGELKQELRKLDLKPIVPPLNFALVEDGIYRSGFPMPTHYPFLKQLGLKTIIYLGDLGLDDKVKKEAKKASNKSGSSDKEKKVTDGKKDESKTDKDGGKSKEKQEKHGTSDILDNYLKWISSTEIEFYHLKMQSSQEPFISSEIQQQSQESLIKALELMLDKRNFPMLIHSNKGKHRIGVLVGLMRKLLQGWCMSGIFEEYEKFALGKSDFDLEFIELWQPELTYEYNCKPDFVRV